MLVGTVALEGLQPMVTEAIFKEGDNIQCGLEDMRLAEMKESNYSWEFWTMVIFAINITFFAASNFVVRKIVRRLEKKPQKDSDTPWGHTERHYYDNWSYTDWKADNLEFGFTERKTHIWNMEQGVSRMEVDEERINNLLKLQECGLILKGGFGLC